MLAGVDPMRLNARDGEERGSIYWGVGSQGELNDVFAADGGYELRGSPDTPLRAAPACP